MRYVCLLFLTLRLLAAQDGATIYKERCAACHDAPKPRVPSLATIKQMSGDIIYLALTQGLMKTQAAGLSTTQILALINYIGPTGGSKANAAHFTATCKSTDTFRSQIDGPQWNGWSPSITNSRFQGGAAARLTAAEVPKLKLKWAFNLGDVAVARSQPTVIGGRIFVATQTGAVYALDADRGCTRWGFQADAGLRSGVTFGDSNGTPAIFFGDGGGNIYAVNAATGELIWKTKAIDQFGATITATPRFFKGVVYQPISSFEEALAADPKYQCCTFRGSVVALDAASGKQIWKAFTIGEAAKPMRKTAGHQQFGPSGAAVWSSPTIDERAGALYVATGDNYSDPVTHTSDAILAIQLKTGEVLWSKQFTEHDTSNMGCASPAKTNCPETGGPDADFGQPPILVDLGEGKREVGIAQKSGMAYAVDPDQKGELLWQTRVGKGGVLGGSQWGSASDGQNMYVAISDIALNVAADAKAPGGYRLVLDPKKGGGLSALDLKSGKIVWNAQPEPCAAGRTDCSPAQSAAVTAIPGVVFSGSIDGHLRAYSTTTGEVLWDTDTEREFATVNDKPAHGGSMDSAGPAVVNGMVFVNSGYSQWGGMPGNVLLAFSVDGK